MHFENRTEGGKALAQELLAYRDNPDVLILALPRGGVPVALEIALTLHAPMDVFMVRKLGVPGQEELAMGAVATGGVRVLNPAVIRHMKVPWERLQAAISREQQELDRRQRTYRSSLPLPEVHNRTVILVDDGLATGATMRAAVLAISHQQPARMIVAVPVAAQETCNAFRDEVDEVVCVVTPEPLHAIGKWYHNFDQISDEQVRQMLEQARTARFPVKTHRAS